MTPRLMCLRETADRFVGDCRGATAMTVGILSPLVVGFAGLGVDATSWQLTRHGLQTTADIAAMAGAMTLAQGGDNADITAAVIKELQRNGFIADGDSNDLSVNLVESSAPSEDGSSKTNVELSVTTAGEQFFTGMFLPHAPVISIGSTAGVLEGGNGDICILGLHETQAGTVSFQGTTDAELNCAVATNSVDGSSLLASGNAAVSTSSLQSYGGLDIGSNTTVVSDVFWPYAARVIDPYGPQGRDLQAPPSSTCDHNGTTQVKKKKTIKPGRYCGDLRINGADVTMKPGIYIIDGGDFKVTGNSSIVGDGVTIVLTGSSANDVGNIDIAGGTHMELSAPDMYDPQAFALGYHGVLIFQDPIADSMQGANIKTNKLLGGSSTVLRGAVYVPRQTLVYSGGATIESGCLQLIALTVEFKGNASMALDEDTCALVGAEPIRSVKVSVFS